MCQVKNVPKIFTTHAHAKTFFLCFYFYWFLFSVSRFAAHRNQSYPNATRKPILSSMKRKDSKDSYSTSQSQSFDTTSPASTATGTPVTSPQKSLSIREESNEEAILSERAGHSEPHSDDSDTDERRVQFNKAKFQIEAPGENIIEEMDIADDGEEKEKKKHKG